MIGIFLPWDSQKAERSKCCWPESVYSLHHWRFWVILLSFVHAFLIYTNLAEQNMALYLKLVQHIPTLKMTPIMKICLANDSLWEDCAEDVGNQDDACENEINQYEDEDRQSITAELFGNNKAEETGIARATHEIARNVSDNNELVAISRNRRDWSCRQRKVC